MTLIPYVRVEWETRRAVAAFERYLRLTRADAMMRVRMMPAAERRLILKDLTKARTHKGKTPLSLTLPVAIRSRRTYASLKAKGMCVGACGSRVKRGVRCDPCRDKVNAAGRAATKAKKEQS